MTPVTEVLFKRAYYAKDIHAWLQDIVAKGYTIVHMNVTCRASLGGDEYCAFVVVNTPFMRPDVTIVTRATAQLG